MSRLDSLKKQFLDYNFTIFDFIKVIDPSKKNTYSDFLFKKIISNIDKNQYYNSFEFINSMSRNIGCTPEELKHLPKFQLFLTHQFMSHFFDNRDLQALKKFEEYRQEGSIKSIDISSFSDFEPIHKIISVVDIKKLDKKWEKQIRIIHQDDDWLILRPLSHESSMKYGMGTRWCTTQYDNPDYFLRYYSRGILLYTINKNSGLKVATFYNLEPYDKEFSFWDDADNRLDSIETGLPHHILCIIKDEIKNNNYTNKDCLTEEQKVMEELYHNRLQNKLRAVNPIFIHNEPEPVPDESLSFTINRTYDMFGNENVTDTTGISW